MLVKELIQGIKDLEYKYQGVLLRNNDSIQLEFKRHGYLNLLNKYANYKGNQDDKAPNKDIQDFDVIKSYIEIIAHNYTQYGVNTRYAELRKLCYNINAVDKLVNSKNKPLLDKLLSVEEYSTSSSLIHVGLNSSTIDKVDTSAVDKLLEPNLDMLCYISACLSYELTQRLWDATVKYIRRLKSEIIKEFKGKASDVELSVIKNFRISSDIIEEIGEINLFRICGIDYSKLGIQGINSVWPFKNNLIETVHDILHNYNITPDLFVKMDLISCKTHLGLNKIQLISLRLLDLIIDNYLMDQSKKRLNNDNS